MYSQTYGKQQATKTAKLKFFCQMCRKQCYDENGFRCHLNSGHHMKMMRQYNEDPEYYVEQFSKEFEDAFFDILKEKYKDTKIGSNKVYEEMIRKIDHVHLNGTKWTKLNDFIQQMIQNNKIGFDHSSGDTVIWAIDSKVESKKYNKVETKKVKIVENQAGILDKAVEQQLKKGQQLQEQQVQQNEQVEVIQEDKLISFDLVINKQPNTVQELENQEVKKCWIDQDLEKQQPNLEKLYQSLKFKNQQNTDQQPQTVAEFAWLKENIIVKINDKNLNNGKLYGKKGVVKQIMDEYSGLVEMQTSNKERVIVDQAFLQTVIPKIGHSVMILKEGNHFGKIGKLESVHQDNFSGSIYLENENELLEIPFDLFSKINCE